MARWPPGAYLRVNGRQPRTPGVRTTGDIPPASGTAPGPAPLTIPGTITPLTLQQAELDRKTTELRLESLRLELASAQKREAEAEQQLGWMKTSLEASTTPEQRQVLQEAIDKQSRRLSKARIQRKATQRTIDQTQQRINDLNDWLERLQEAYRQQQEASLVADLKRLEERSAEDITRLNRRIRELNAQLAATESGQERQRALIEARIDSAENQIFSTQTRLKLATARSAFEHLGARNRELGPADIELIQDDLKRIDRITRDIKPIIKLLRRKLDLIQSQQTVLQQKVSAGQIPGPTGARIVHLYEADEQTFNAQLKEAQARYSLLRQKERTLTETYRRLLNEDLSARQHLPSTPGLAGTLLNELFGLPGQMKQLLAEQIRLLRGQSATLPMEQLWGALLLLILPLGSGIVYHYRMRGTRRRALQAQTFSARISAIGLHVLRGISIPGALMIGLSGALWTIGASPLLLELSLLLFGIWVLIRLLRDLSYWFLVSPLVPAAQQQASLHRNIGLNIWVSGILGLLMGLGWQGVTSEPFAAVANRLFMLSLLPAVYLSLRLRSLVISRLREHGTQGYWLWVVRLISLPVPLAMLGVAVPDLAGYINLARLVAWYLIITLLIATVWLVLRGLLGDFVSLLTRYVEQDGKRGRLWYEGLIRPLHLLARVLLAILALLLITRVYGLGEQSTALELIRSTLGHALFTIGSTEIDLAHLPLFLGVAVGAFPAGAWVRRLSFNWLYAGITDRGVRNSLAVFSQYVTVSIGLLLSVNLLGIDLTSLAVFAGALGVGIGFGLQNIANNFISGLILLAERPNRVGDWVTIGDYEGEISAIGIRSATLTTWDNQDVVIPNAELISNAFINWTLSNPLVRTVLKVGISYAADPHQAKQVIEEAVSMQPEVLLDPAPRVQLINFGDSSVDFRVLYYMDVTQFGRMEIKSRVMFAIWDALKEADIEIPFPQRDIHIRELPPQTPLADQGGSTDGNGG